MRNLYSALEFLDGSGCHLISQGMGSRGKCRKGSNFKDFGGISVIVYWSSTYRESRMLVHLHA